MSVVFFHKNFIIFSSVSVVSLTCSEKRRRKKRETQSSIKNTKHEAAPLTSEAPARVNLLRTFFAVAGAGVATAATVEVAGA